MIIIIVVIIMEASSGGADPTIFVSIPSYRDPECQYTVSLSIYIYISYVYIHK